jgi:hypothetical protein
LQDPSQINSESLNSIKCEDSRHVRNKEREYLNDEVNELATHSKNKNITDLFKKGYQLPTNMVKDKNGYLLADFRNILNRWKNYFSQLLNVHGVSDGRQVEIHTAEPSIPGPSSVEVEIAISEMKRYISPGR